MKETIPVDQVRKYLASLTPQARASLLVEIERKLLYGESVPGADLMLAELRAEFRKSGQSGDRAGSPSRYFFSPIEALFVDRPPELVNSGQISRGSLSAIWEWINQILLPTMARDYCDQMKRAIVLNNAQEAKSISAAFQFKVVKYLEATLGSHQGIEGARSGLGKFTTSRASFDDLKKILAEIYDIEDALRVRIDGLDKSDWGRRLDELTRAVADNLQAEFQTLPENTRHVLGSGTRQRHCSAPGFLTNLVRRSRDAITARLMN
jgi:hypothetical protein